MAREKTSTPRKAATTARAKPAARPKAAPAVVRSVRKPRVAAKGDTGPTATGQPGIENFAVAEAVDAAQEARLAAMRDLISGAPLGEAAALLKALMREQRVRADTDANPDDELNPDWRDG